MENRKRKEEKEGKKEKKEGKKRKKGKGKRKKSKIKKGKKKRKKRRGEKTEVAFVFILLSILLLAHGPSPLSSWELRKKTLNQMFLNGWHFLVADRVGRFQSRAVSTAIANSKATDDFCFTI